MKTLSHGTMPSRDEFAAAFAAACPHGHYSVKLGAYSPNAAMAKAEGKHSVEALYSLVESLANEWDGIETHDDCGALLASAIMETLGFEWV